MQHIGIPFLLKMQPEVLFFSPHFIDHTLNTRAECVRDSLICRKYMAKIFALRSMGIQQVPSPLQMCIYGNCSIYSRSLFKLWCMIVVFHVHLLRVQRWFYRAVTRTKKNFASHVRKLVTRASHAVLELLVKCKIDIPKGIIKLLEQNKKIPIY